MKWGFRVEVVDSRGGERNEEGERRDEGEREGERKEEGERREQVEVKLEVASEMEGEVGVHASEKPLRAGLALRVKGPRPLGSK